MKRANESLSKNECKVLMNLIIFDPLKLGTPPMLEALTVYLSFFFPMEPMEPTNRLMIRVRVQRMATMPTITEEDPTNVDVFWRCCLP